MINGLHAFACPISVWGAGGIKPFVNVGATDSRSDTDAYEALKVKVKVSLSLSLSISICIYIYIQIEIERERERETLTLTLSASYASVSERESVAPTLTNGLMPPAPHTLMGQANACKPLIMWGLLMLCGNYVRCWCQDMAHVI